MWLNYFSERMGIFGKSECVSRVAERGCSQGSVCGPVVWNLVMDELLCVLEQSGLRMDTCADDLLIVSREVIERKDVECLRRVIEWGRDAGLTVCEEKKVCMLLRGISSECECGQFMCEVCENSEIPRYEREKGI